MVTSTKNQSALSAEEKRLAGRVIRSLTAAYPDADCSLRFDSPLQLLVATILSAQCTDERVNRVTIDLFANYPTAVELADVPLKKLEQAIRSTGFFRNKAKNIKACCQKLMENAVYLLEIRPSRTNDDLRY